jgi:hypothetical protein
MNFESRVFRVFPRLPASRVLFSRPAEAARLLARTLKDAEHARFIKSLFFLKTESARRVAAARKVFRPLASRVPRLFSRPAEAPRLQNTLRRLLLQADRFAQRSDPIAGRGEGLRSNEWNGICDW